MYKRQLDDVIIGQLEAKRKKVDVHFYYTPRILSNQTFIFDPEQMCSWWHEGFEKGVNSTPETHCLEYHMKA